MKTKLSKSFWATLALFGLMGQVAWVVENMYLNVFIYKMFNATAKDISLMVALSAVTATLTTVLMGALSDRVGKRKLFISVGYILWGVSIFCFALLKTDVIESVFPMAASAAAMGVSLTIFLDCLMTFFGSTANDAAFNAWLTDSTDSTNRGVAEGINAMMPLVAILVVFGGFMAFDLDRAESWSLIFTIIGVCVLVIGVTGLFIIKEKKLIPSESGYLKNVVYGFLPSTVKSNLSFYFYLLMFIIFNISIQIFMPYLIIYYEVSLGMTDYVFVMAPAIILASALTAFLGKVYDKKGFGFSSVISIVSLSVGYVILYVFRATLPVFVGSLLMMCGYLSGMAVFGAKIRDLTPEGKAGMLQGVRIFSQVLIPGIVGPSIGRAVLSSADTIVNNDGTESFVPSSDIFLASLVPIILLALFLVINKKSKKPRLCKGLETPFEKNTDMDWTEYPRPQMKRESYISLCGEWELSVKGKKGISPLGKIKVPFPPESRLSGIERELGKNEQYIYKRSFILSEKELAQGRVILHFGAVDQIAQVSVNGQTFPEHTGGYLPFEYDLTECVRLGENELTVTVTDTLDTELAYGKQRKNRGGMWYTPVSGIWQAVWLECLPEKHIKSLRVTPTLHSVRIDTVGGEDEKTVAIALPDGIKKYTYTGDSVTLKIDSPVNWTPESPYLYEFVLISGEDRIESYFALRTVEVKRRGERSYIALNGKPYFFHGLLDQGYYSDGIYTPATPEGYIFDIKHMKSQGFNMLRKHIKIEPELFYYYCDKIGMIVFQDMVNSGKYSFLLDTALPTLGMKRGISHRATEKRRQSFIKDSKETLDLLYNHPCVCYYTVFNEGWGQFDADGMYEMLKEYDPTRIYDATSGWFTETKSDVSSEHVYFKKLDLKSKPEKPMVLSEFGGYSCKIEGHSFNLDKTYGYRFFKTTEALSDALEKLYRNEVIPMIERGLCASVITQVSDIEDETNGIVTYDRQIIKTDAARMKAISEEIYSAFERAAQSN